MLTRNMALASVEKHTGPDRNHVDQLSFMEAPQGVYRVPGSKFEPRVGVFIFFGYLSKRIA